MRCCTLDLEELVIDCISVDPLSVLKTLRVDLGIWPQQVAPAVFKCVQFSTASQYRTSETKFFSCQEATEQLFKSNLKNN